MQPAPEEMDGPTLQALDEIKRLQGCINDLVSIQALAGIWVKFDEPQIVGTLLEVLIRILRLDFACARVNASIGGAPIETIRLAPGRNPEARSEELRRLGTWLKGEVPVNPVEIPNPIDTGNITVATLRLGLQDDVGLIVTASRRTAFPSEVDMVLLRAATNQAVIALQEVRVLRRAENRLRRIEAQLAEGQRLSRTGSWGWDVSSGELLFSEETFGILGFDPGQPAPLFQEAIGRIHEDDRAAVDRVIEAAVRDRKDYEFEARLFRPDGTIRQVQCVGRPFTNESGCLEYVGTLLDVTRRKRTEESLRAAEAQLVHVARVTTMGELTASIAHEVKQPLAAVAMNASAALNWIAGDKPNLDEARTALTRIVKGTDRATQIVDRIRAFMTRRQSITATVAMNDLIHEVLALTRHEVLKEHISLRVELAADLRDTVGDPVQLQQVMVNLIVNAIDAMRAQTADRRELVVCSRNDGPDDIIISVRDSGVGIEASRMDEMFAPFITTKPNGMGMGLAISRSIIEAHGGRIFAAPNPDRGATFRFSLSANGAISPP